MFTRGNNGEKDVLSRIFGKVKHKGFGICCPQFGSLTSKGGEWKVHRDNHYTATMSGSEISCLESWKLDVQGRRFEGRKGIETITGNLGWPDYLYGLRLDGSQVEVWRQELLAYESFQSPPSRVTVSHIRGTWASTLSTERSTTHWQVGVFWSSQKTPGTILISSLPKTWPIPLFP